MNLTEEIYYKILKNTGDNVTAYSKIVELNKINTDLITNIFILVTSELLDEIEKYET